MAEYAIQPLSLRCARTGRELKVGEAYYSALSESSEGFVRTDYCAEAWTGPPDGTVAFWRSLVPEAAGAKRQAMVDDSVVMDFFVQLADAQDAYKRNFRFILALLLLRRKLLKLVASSRDEGAEVLVLRAPANGEEHRVVNPDLSEEELAAVQAEVERVLQSAVE